MAGIAGNGNNVGAPVPMELEGDTPCDLMYIGNPTIRYPKRYATYTNAERKTFKCWHCPTVSYDFDVYKRHRAGHANKFTYACDKCTYSCDRAQILDVHSKCHTPGYFKRNRPHPSESTWVGAFTRSQSLETNGIATAIQENIGESVGKDESELKVKCKKQRPFIHRCKDPHCPSIYQNPADLQRHMLRHQLMSEFRCHLCTYASHMFWHLKWHLKKHETANMKRRYSKKCNQRARPISSSSLSYRIVSSSTGEKAIFLPSENRFMCPSANCPMVMASARDILVHLKQHNSEKRQFQCEKCSYSVGRRTVLNKHSALHFRNRALLKLKSDLNSRQSQSESICSPRHLISTSSPKPSTFPSRSWPPSSLKYKCADVNCPQNFHKRSDALRHIANLHNGTGIFKCDQCTFGSKLAHNLERHKEKHSQVVPDNSWKTIVVNKVNMDTSFSTEEHNTQDFQDLNPTPAKFQPAVYRPTWYKKTKPRRMPDGLQRRHRRDLLRDGLVSSATELAVIRQGNPKFTYETHVTYKSGRVVPVNFRCFHCPRAFESFDSYNLHKRTHARNLMRNSAWTCKVCNYDSNNENHFYLHCKQHASTRECWIRIRKYEIPEHSAHMDVDSSFYCIPDETREVGLRKTGNPLTDGFGEAPDFRLVSAIEVHNFMKFDVFTFKPDDRCNLCGLQGVHDCGKTSIILACLIGMAYDLLLGLNQSATICGVPLAGILKRGATAGHVEITLELKPYKVLLEKYDSPLKLRRYFFQGLALSEAEFEISYGTVQREIITMAEVKDIMTKILPVYALRLMVLNAENLDYFLNTPLSCNDMFWTVASQQESHLRQKLQAVQDQIEDFSIDLESRQSRISFLKDSLKDCDENDSVRTLRDMQTKEYEVAQEEHAVLEDEFRRLMEEEDSLNTQLNNYLEKLVEKMRKLFKQYISAQNYVGDLVICTDPKEFGVWMKDIRTSENETESQPKTMEEVRRIWRKHLLGGHRRLAITALFLAFWRVLDTCPILLGDAYSTSESEFRLPDSSMPLLVDTIREGQNRQFFISVPGDSPDEFVQKYT